MNRAALYESACNVEEFLRRVTAWTGSAEDELTEAIEDAEKLTAALEANWQSTRDLAEAVGYTRYQSLDRSLVELAAERDQLRQQVEKLLDETTRAGERFALADEAEWGDDFEAEVSAVSEALKAAADQVRKELEGR